MEGVCDREARSITRQTADRFGVAVPADALGVLSLRDVTGTLTEEDAGRALDVSGSEEETRYAAALSAYERGVNRRYAVFLEEYAPGEEDALHALLLASIVSGDVCVLVSGWTTGTAPAPSQDTSAPPPTSTPA